jgi:predicted RNase H-like nuclease (RuvC/YqgF family)
MEKDDIKNIDIKEIDNIIKGEPIDDALNADIIAALRTSLDFKDKTIEEQKHDIELLWKDNQEKSRTIKEQNQRIITLTDRLTDSMDKTNELHQNTQVLFKQILEQQPKQLEENNSNRKGFFSKIFKKS